MMSDEEIKKIVKRANLALDAVMRAMKCDDLENFDRYLNMYSNLINQLPKSVEYKRPVISFMPGTPGVH